MVEIRHIKLDYGDSLSSKKQLLSSELNILNIIRILKTYKLLKKKEFIERNKLKTNITSLKTKINFILSTFPEQEKKEIIKNSQIIPKKIQKTPKVKSKNVQKTPTKKDQIEKELEDIKSKLAKLS